MPVYIAMLRGINVGKHKRMKMDQLRASFEALGFTEVKSYIQSGNVVFRAGRISPSGICGKLEERIVSDFGFSASVISRTRDEMEKIIRGNPFLRDSRFDQSKLHVTFFAETPSAPALKELEQLTTKPDQSHGTGKEIYLYLPNGVSKSSLVNNPLERRLLNDATMRNWRTVNSLYEIAAGYR